jgi:hypothetical protein
VTAAPDIPLGRPGSPEEGAKAILFLASPLASYITGHTLEVSCTFGYLFLSAFSLSALPPLYPSSPLIALPRSARRARALSAAIVTGIADDEAMFSRR